MLKVHANDWRTMNLVDKSQIKPGIFEASVLPQENTLKKINYEPSSHEDSQSYFSNYTVSNLFLHLIRCSNITKVFKIVHLHNAKNPTRNFPDCQT
jgi:hypothetical protein